MIELGFRILGFVGLLAYAATAVRESTMVGESEFDRECRRWWRKVVCWFLLVIGLIAALVAYHYFG